MGLYSKARAGFARWVIRAANYRDNGGWFHHALSGYRTETGRPMSPDIAMSVSTVMDCVRIRGTMMGMLPIVLYERTKVKGRDSRSRATNHPLFQVLHDQPNAWQTRYDFVVHMQQHIDLRGNAYAVKMPGMRGAVDQLIPLHPDRVKVKRLKTGTLVYEFKPYPAKPGDKQPDTIAFLQSEIFHVRGPFTVDGITSVSPIELARTRVGLLDAAEATGARFFGNSAIPPITLSTDGPVSADDAKLILQKWNEASQGIENSSKTVLLPFGIKAVPLSLSMRDAQFMDLRKFQKADVASLYGVPLHMLDSLEDASFNNVESLNQGFYTNTLLPNIVCWELAIRRDIITQKNKYFAKFLPDAILRADIKTRYDAYSKAITHGFMNPNEARDREDIEPRDDDGGEEFLIPSGSRTNEEVDAKIAEMERKGRESDANAADVQKQNDKLTEDGKKKDEESARLETQLEGKAEYSRALTNDLVLALHGENCMELERDDVIDSLQALESERSGTMDSLVYSAWGIVEAQAETSEHVDTIQQMSTEALHGTCQRVEQTEVFAEYRYNHLSGVLMRLIDIEVRGVRRALRCTNFLSSIDTHYEKHMPRLAAAVDQCDTGDSLATDWCAESKRQLLEACECTPDELPAVVCQLIDSWVTRPSEVASEYVYSGGIE